MSEQPMVVDESAPGQGPRLQDGDVALVTGGLGGIGLALARRLAGQARVRIALLSRRGLPVASGGRAGLRQSGNVCCKPLLIEVFQIRAQAGIRGDHNQPADLDAPELQIEVSV
jgi:NAD(P)-dependent dehydrogenase (short-subunit alcohol dehydrogenase family)